MNQDPAQTENERRPVYTLSDETKAWCKRQYELCGMSELTSRYDDGRGILWEKEHFTAMNGQEANIVAHLQPSIGDWACYFGPGDRWFVYHHGRKMPEQFARAVFPEVPADLQYRP
jgi:hypothetical protein